MRRAQCGKDVRSSIRCRGALSSILVAFLACSSTAEPHTGVTLHVTNAPCLLGACSPVHVLAFPQKQPLTPGGLWSIDLGLLTAPGACLTFPPSATFRIWEVGSTDTTKITWTPADSVELGALGPEESRFTALPSTSEFVPASASGWFVTLPGGTRASPGPRCAPWAARRQGAAHGPRGR